MRALCFLSLALVVGCDPLGVWNDIQDGPDDSAEGEGDAGEGEGDAGEGEGEGEGPLPACCDNLDDVTLPPETEELVSFALNHAGVAHAVFQRAYAGVGEPRPVNLGIASGSAFALELIDGDGQGAGLLSFDAQDRALITTSSTSSASVMRRVSAGTWESLDVFGAPGPPFVSHAFPATPTADGELAVAVELVTSEDPGEGSCPCCNFVCRTYDVAIGTTAGSDPFVARDIGSTVYPMAVGGEPGAFVLAWVTYPDGDIVVAREDALGEFGTATLASGLPNAQLAITPDGTIVVAGIEDPYEPESTLVLLTSGASFSRTVLSESPRLSTFASATLGLGADGSALVVYELAPAIDGSAPGELRLARVRGDEEDDALVRELPAGTSLQRAFAGADTSGRPHVVWIEYDGETFHTHYVAP